MVRLNWNESGTRFYDAGVDRGVLYLQNGSAVPWDGLISVKEAPSDSDVTTGYFDGRAYNTRRTPGSFAATIEAYTYPDEFEQFGSLRIGDSLRRRNLFSFSYRTKMANDISGLDKGYKLHLVYNALAVSSQRSNTTLTNSAEIETFSWDISTTPASISGGKRSAHLVVDTTLAHSWAVEALESLLYGSETQSSVLPQPNEVLELVESKSIVRITDNGDGTWTAEGPDELVKMLDPTTFQIDIPTAVFIDTDIYRLSSY